MNATFAGFKILSIELSVHPKYAPIAVTLNCRTQVNGVDMWAICEEGFCLNHDSEWEYEPRPSERTPEFIERCRWPSMDAAIDFWRNSGCKSRLV